MPDLVLDASAAGKLFRDEPGSGELRQLVKEAARAGHQVLAPPVFRHELLNIVARTVQEGALPPEGALGHYARVMDVVRCDELAPSDDLDAAIRHRITSHDAAYLVTARVHGAVLVSYDRRQLQAAQDTLQVQSPGREDFVD